MWRLYLDGFLIFLVPFALYSSWRAWAERDPKAALRYTRGPVAWLSLAGLILVVGSVVISELRETPHTGGYQRAIWKDGRLIPAEVK